MRLMRRMFHLPKRSFHVLGIETSCDDTGAAVVSDNGQILGDSLKSQTLIHLRHGGIQPPVAGDLHKENIGQTVQEALDRSKLNLRELSAVAATVKPGLALSLLVGARYGQNFALRHNLPFIPIHHMEAHALTARMNYPVEFPFLVLLISGGHCLLAVAKSVDRFLLLGQSLDDAPGEAFDKVARRLKLTNLGKYRNTPSGPALEDLAETGDPLAFEFPPILTRYQDCNFSFSGIKNTVRKYVLQAEKSPDFPADGLIPRVNDLAASFQYTVARHICHRVQRAIEFVNRNKLLKLNKQLVVSGGVASNKFIRKMVCHVAQIYDYEVVVPEPKLCTDNGIMIAWNGVERFRLNLGVVPPEKALEVDIQSRCPFGEDISAEVTAASIKCKWIKLPI